MATKRARDKSGGMVDRPYHHGSLPEALLAAAHSVLRRDGIAGLGLRSIAREAGVSHTAPKHHFGDTAGLLSELAAVGFRRLGEAMSTAALGAPDIRTRRNAIGMAYVHFAYENSALFGLMFRNEIIDMRRPSLAEASASAMRVMAPIVALEPSLAESPPTMSEDDAVRVTAAWAFVHGLATLLIDQRLRGILKRTMAFDDAVTLADATLHKIKLGLDF
jgi:AcrR family transcriptional regulator